MADRAQPMTKERFLQEMTSEYEALDVLLASLGPDQLAEPGVYDELAVKDVLAHLTAWSRLAVGWVEASERGETPVRFAPGFEANDSNYREVIDRFNAHVLEENRDRHLDDTRANFRAAHGRMMALAQALTNDDLTDSGRFPWLGNRPLWPTLAENGYEHYREHRELIQRWLDQSGQ